MLSVRTLVKEGSAIVICVESANRSAIGSAIGHRVCNRVDGPGSSQHCWALPGRSWEPQKSRWGSMDSMDSMVHGMEVPSSSPMDQVHLVCKRQGLPMCES